MAERARLIVRAPCFCRCGCSRRGPGRLAASPASSGGGGLRGAGAPRLTGQAPPLRLRTRLTGPGSPRSAGRAARRWRRMQRGARDTQARVTRVVSAALTIAPLRRASFQFAQGRCKPTVAVFAAQNRMRHRRENHDEMRVTALDSVIRGDYSASSCTAVLHGRRRTCPELARAGHAAPHPNGAREPRDPRPRTVTHEESEPSVWQSPTPARA
jgi:hypothetical protein